MDNINIDISVLKKMIEHAESKNCSVFSGVYSLLGGRCSLHFSGPSDRGDVCFHVRVNGDIFTNISELFLRGKDE